MHHALRRTNKPIELSQSTSPFHKGRGTKVRDWSSFQRCGDLAKRNSFPSISDARLTGTARNEKRREQSTQATLSPLRLALCSPPLYEQEWQP
jgi:hypothetical protein